MAFRFLVLFSAGILATPLQAGTLTITSTPPGATVEIDGVAAGKTPYHQDFPGAYFQKPHSVFTRRLEHSMTAKISLDGYESQEITLTEGPHMYYTANGKLHGNYWLLKAGHFEVSLKKVKTGAAPAAQKTAAYHLRDLIQRMPLKQTMRFQRPLSGDVAGDADPGKFLMT